jgi:hypothetical protein
MATCEKKALKRLFKEPRSKLHIPGRALRSRPHPARLQSSSSAVFAMGTSTWVVSKNGYDTANLQLTIPAGGAGPPMIFLHRQKSNDLAGPGDAVSLCELRIPDKALSCGRGGTA